MTFRGFPAQALDFFGRLEADNTKTFWLANKPIYESSVKGPFDQLCADLHEEYGTLKIFRPHRDARFSKDKTPYKTHTGAAGETDGGAMLYIQLSKTGLFVGTGYYMMATDQLARFRSAIDDETIGAELVKLLDVLNKGKFSMDADSLKTAPRGYPKDHPRIELLRRKWMTVGKDFGAPAWLHTGKAVDRIRSVFTAAEPLNAWLNAHVGPSTLPPSDWGRN